MAELKDRLRELRKKNKLSQKDLGNFLGISESAYGYYEQGRNEPSLDSIKKIAEKYDVTVSYLTGEIDHPTNALDQQHPDESLFFFDEDNITEEEKEELKKHLQYLRWKAEQENKKKS